MSCEFNDLGTSKIDIGSGASLDLTSWTCAFWIKATSWDTPGTLKRFVDDSAEAGSILLAPRASADGTLVGQQIAATTPAVTNTSSAVSLNTWTFIVFRFHSVGDGGDGLIDVFIGDESTPIAEASYDSRVAGDGAITPLGTSTLGIGNRPGGDRGFHGLICHFGLWNSVLSDAEAEQWRTGDTPTAGLAAWINMMTHTDVADESGNGNDGTISLVTTNADNPSAYTPGGGGDVPFQIVAKLIGGGFIDSGIIQGGIIL